ncbi:antitoxin [Streptomyces sp. LP11]|uniref:Antitoxin n=1 Tax=Streptomyces pyxinicus TaxID=2970331 RepID=A0ABT2BB27_9ACTN|nr:antitoxin [Streptomyces sp. LP11]MCS0605739.1 antitoxin [Streptomyces sp. LP11]
MGLLDNMKHKLAPAKDKVSDLARQHGDKVQHGIDKAARAVDERTKGKYTDKIHAGTDKAKDAMDRLAHKEGPGSGPDRTSADPTVPLHPEGTGTASAEPRPPTRPEGPPPAS